MLYTGWCKKKDAVFKMYTGQRNCLQGKDTDKTTESEYIPKEKYEATVIWDYMEYKIQKQYRAEENTTNDGT